MSDRNAQAVKAIYAAFEEGDVPAILDRMSESTQWGFNVSHSHVPWHTTFHGKRGVSRFFGALVEAARITKLQPISIVAGGGSEVVALVELELHLRRSGKTLQLHQVHWWSFDPDGKVARLQQFEDTAAVLAAWQAETSSS